MDRRRLFNKMASEWESRFTDEAKETAMREALDRIDLPGAATILDLGCGAGKLIPLLIERSSPKALLIGVDYAEEMIRVARKVHQNPNVFPVLADSFQLPFRDKTFDRIVMLALFAHLPDKLQALREIRRVMKPGSYMLLVHLAGKETIHRIHHEKGGPLENDSLPSAAALLRLFREVNLETRETVDEPDLYLAVAARPG